MTDQKSLSSRAWAELLLLSAIWGGIFLSVRIALDEIGVLTAVAHRVFWAALVLWGVVAALRLPLPLLVLPVAHRRRHLLLQMKHLRARAVVSAHTPCRRAVGANTRNKSKTNHQPRGAP